MSLLQHEIEIFVDSNPGILTERIRDDQVEIEIRDAGSARAAQITFRAFGQLMAARRAEKKHAEIAAAGRNTPSLSLLQERETAAARDLVTKLAVAREATEVKHSQQGYAFTIPETEGDLFLETIAAAPELTQRLSEPHPALAYYAGITPHLLETAELSVDGNSYKYSF
jgi:hypothetical protein